MLSKRGIEIRSAKTLLDSGTQPHMYNGVGVVIFGGSGAPRAERGPGVNSNMTDFRFCKLQNRRGKCRSFVRIMT